MSKKSEPSSTNSGAAPKTRRAFLTLAALGTVNSVANSVVAQGIEKESAADGGVAAIQPKRDLDRVTPVTPPGSEGLKHLKRHCTTCQLCISACPNGVLRPSERPGMLMMPEMGFERGYCRPECVRCSSVCPTGAIRILDVARKAATHVGIARWRASLCVVNTDGVPCGNCARHCPAQAIQMVPKKENPKVKIPAVDEDRCLGCGACENLCPSRPVSAIYVEGVERHRVG